MTAPSEKLLDGVVDAAQIISDFANYRTQPTTTTWTATPLATPATMSASPPPSLSSLLRYYSR
ncbi:hypothetical protein GQ600_10131 [Phytophthora cactorum]|nr:hypothetical protein GQ600_10131 [Phytophthora cactorum]